MDVGGAGGDPGLARDRSHRGAVEAALGDERAQRRAHRRGAIGRRPRAGRSARRPGGRLAGRRRAHAAAAAAGLTISCSPVSRSETCQSFAIAESMPTTRKIGLRTGGPLLTQSGP